MNILLINPEIPDTYWSFKHAIKFISKKSASLPLGLITVSAMFPETWKKKLVDMNIRQLKKKDIKWADYVFLSSMSVQKESAEKVIKLVQHMGKKVVAGGPHFTGNPENYNYSPISISGLYQNIILVYVTFSEKIYSQNILTIMITNNQVNYN